MRNPLTQTWRDRYKRPFKPLKEHRVPFVVTPRLDTLSALLRKLRDALIG